LQYSYFLMRSLIFVGAMALVVCVCALAAQSAADLAGFLKGNRNAMSRVTAKPYRVVNPGLMMCAPPAFGAQQEVRQKPHEDHWIHVFVTGGGTNAMATGKGVYPVGTVILKQKLLDAEGKVTEFYTGMRKREAGYNSDCGDWEFFTLDRTGEKVTAQGRIDSCMDCHVNYKWTDFVSRVYLAGRKGGG
jgi:hypothetical protein